MLNNDENGVTPLVDNREQNGNTAQDDEVVNNKSGYSSRRGSANTQEGDDEHTVSHLDNTLWQSIKNNRIKSMEIGLFVTGVVAAVVMSAVHAIMKPAEAKDFWMNAVPAFFGNPVNITLVVVSVLAIVLFVGLQVAHYKGENKERTADESKALQGMSFAPRHCGFIVDGLKEMFSSGESISQ